MHNNDLTKLVATFKEEASEYTAALNSNLLAIERAMPDDDLVARLEDIFRDAHSLKGAAHMVGFTQIERIAHQLESVLDTARGGALDLTPNVCNVIYNAIDVIDTILSNSNGSEETMMETEELVARLEVIRAGGSPGREWSPIQAAAQPAEAPAPQQKKQSVHDNGETIRVNITQLEKLMAQSNELVVFKITAQQRLADLKKLRRELQRKYKTWASSAGQNDVGDSGHHDDKLVHRLVKEFLSDMAALEHKQADDTLRLGLVIENVQDSIRQARMLPFANMVAGLRRMVRDLSQTCGKQVSLEITGEEIRVDKKILEEIRDPIMHLLRNAVDHGLEAPEARKANGKPEAGVVRLDFWQTGNTVGVTIEDDGIGLDLDAVKLAVLRDGIMTDDDVAVLSESELAQLVFLPGVSTREQVSNLSGRGVGLDVVHHKLKGLHGNVTVYSEAGKGTRFELTLPPTLSTTHGLLVRVQDEAYALPLSAITKIVIPKAESIMLVNEREMITLDGKPTAVVHMGSLLGLDPPPVEAGTRLKLVVVRWGEIEIGFLVDDLLGEQEMVIKTLGQQLEHVPNVAGATLLGTGDVVLILNPAELIQSAQGVNTLRNYQVVEALDADDEEATILVVDDSITTRTLEKNILEAAGYRVVTATNGREALDYLKGNLCDLVVSDVQMPYMDGIELAGAVKHSPDLGHLPLILVTSLESDEDRQRGLDTGADAYIVKSGFDQEDLLHTIRQLI